RFVECNASGALEGEAVGAGADRGERDGAQIMLGGECEAVPVAARQELVFAAAAAIPDRAHRVNHPASREVVAGSDAGLAGGAAAQLPALLQQCGPGRAVDSAVHAAA